MAADWVTDVKDGLSVIHGQLINNGRPTTNNHPKLNASGKGINS